MRVRPQFPPFNYKDPAVLLERLRAALPPAHRQALEVTLEPGLGIFLVGGIVRDLLLLRPNTDLDFVTLDYAPEVVRRFLPAFKRSFNPVKFLEHAAFGTVRLDLGVDLHLDFATARREVYAHPAALPTVTFPATLKEDLKRRDFTINALALSPKDGLHDPYNGLADLRDGWLRVLHDASFIDDPTRMIRAIRFAARLGYKLEPHTRQLLETARDEGFFELLSAERQRNELRMVLKELRPVKGLALLQDYKMLVRFHPSLAWDDELAGSFGRLEDFLGRPQSYEYLAALLHRQGNANATAIVKGLNFAGLEASVPPEVARLWEDVFPELPSLLKNSRLDLLFRPYKAESLRVFEALLPEEGRQSVRRYREEVLGRGPELNGSALLQLGVPPGPRIKELLGRLRAAVLDGEVVGREAELAFLTKLLVEEPD